MSDITLTSTGTQTDIDAALAMPRTRSTPPPTTAAPSTTAAASPSASTPPTSQPPTQAPPTPVPDASSSEPPKSAAGVETKPEAKPEVKPDAREPKPSTIETMQGRIDKLTHAKYATEAQLEQASAEINRLQREMAAIKAAVPAKAEPATYQSKPAPSEDDIGSTYASYADYTAAVAKWAAEDAVAKLRHEQRQENEQAQRDRQATESKQAEQQAIEQYQGRAVEFAKETPDFNEVVGTLNPAAIHPFIMAHILESEMGPQLVYHLAQHPEEVTKIHALKKAGQVVAYLGRLEAKIEKAAPAEEKKVDPPTPVLTTPAKVAPEPIEPIRGASVTTDVQPTADGSNFRAWKERRDEEVRASRRR